MSTPCCKKQTGVDLTPSSAQKPSAKFRSTQSGRRHLPLFLKYRMARGYAQTCAAMYRLACALLRLGQSIEVVVHDLALLRSDFPALIVLEIVLAARQMGGA